MRILFIFMDLADEESPNYRGEYSLSLGYLSSILKKNGHETGLIHIIKDIPRETLFQKIDDFKPDLIGFSAISQMAMFVEKYSKWIKESYDVPIILGGAHTTLNPNEAIVIENVDMICVGEGELSLLELCNNMRDGKPIDNIQSIWIKHNGIVKKNPTRPLPENLDDLPKPDRSLFDIANLEYANKKYPFATIRAGRGCRYMCTYCSNHIIKKSYINGKKLVRFHSVDRVINEAKEILNIVPNLKSFYFHDDILPYDIVWFREFAEKWKKEIGVPYRCKCRVELMNEERARLLKESGCFRIQFGIESGNKDILKLLKRPIKYEKILYAFKVCKQYNIQTHSFNMVGIPHEDSAKILDTIKVNAKVKPEIAIATIYYPLPNTELYNICKEENLLTDVNLVSMHLESTINLKDISKSKVKFFHRYFRTLIEVYNFLYKLPEPISQKTVSCLDYLLINIKLPYDWLAYVHDKYFKNYLLDRAYFKVEDKIFGDK